MPGVSLHFVLVGELLERWRRRPRSAPFDIDDADSVEAFYQGTLGPDLGYFPGGDKLLSDLAHRVRSVDLARTLVEAARSSTERAFSWGWVAHILGDKAIHPLVGRGVGEFLYGDNNVFVCGIDALVHHVRVETGLDTVFRSRWPDGGVPEPVFDQHSIGYLEDGYGRTYGIGVDRATLLASHTAVVRAASWSLALTGALAGMFPQGRTAPGPRKLVRCLLERARALADRHLGVDALTLAYLTPIPPSPWLVDEVRGSIRSFPALFAEHQEDRLGHLPNFDLDTGEPDVPGLPSEAVASLLSRLEPVRGYEGWAGERLMGVAQFGAEVWTR